jgi:hypothetical protein
MVRPAAGPSSWFPILVEPLPRAAIEVSSLLHIGSTHGFSAIAEVAIPPIRL